MGVVRTGCNRFGTEAMKYVTLEDLAREAGLTRAILYKYVKTCKDALGDLKRGEDNRILLTEEQVELLLKIRGLNRLEGVPLSHVKERLQSGEPLDLEVTRQGPADDASGSATGLVQELNPARGRELAGLLSGLAQSLNQIEGRLTQQAKAIETLSRRQEEAVALRRENQELRRRMIAARGIAQVSPDRAKPSPIALPWYLRWWYELVAPEKLRVNAERVRSLSPA